MTVQEPDMRVLTVTQVKYRVKSGNFGKQVNSDTHLQTVEIRMRRLIKSRLIRIFTVCIVDLSFIPIIQKLKKQGRCPNLADCPNIPDFTLTYEHLLC